MISLRGLVAGFSRVRLLSSSSCRSPDIPRDAQTCPDMPIPQSRPQCSAVTEQAVTEAVDTYEDVTEAVNSYEAVQQQQQLELESPGSGGCDGGGEVQEGGAGACPETQACEP